MKFIKKVFDKEINKDSLNDTLEKLGLLGLSFYWFPMILISLLFANIISSIFPNHQGLSGNSLTVSIIVSVIFVILFTVFARYIFNVKKQSIIDNYTKRSDKK